MRSGEAAKRLRACPKFHRALILRSHFARNGVSKHAQKVPEPAGAPFETALRASSGRGLEL
ncbi:hypothetical protein BOSE21B_100120 [Bosea sp. 21B]|nr:hypothetical protein BOSE21B_100120 [Bosea sp. 21B]CAD5286192.1 hypothetical protein BOSE7B_41409 [Bosea sp. 7B]